MQTAVFTYHGTERVMRYAFEYARRHGRKKVTSATKSNAINYSMVFWDDIFREVSAKYPDIQHEQQLIDSLCARFVIKPESLDVVVASNLFGDIVTDLGAAIAGSMGLAPERQSQPRRTLSEPVPGDPRLGARHRGQRYFQSHRHDLVSLDDAGSSRRSSNLAQPC